MFKVGTYLIPVVFHAYLFTENVTFEYKYISLPLNINNATVFSKGRGQVQAVPSGVMESFVIVNAHCMARLRVCAAC